MEQFLSFIAGLISGMVKEVTQSLIHNWLPLSLSILLAAIISVYVDADKMKDAILKKPKISIWASVAFGAFTPFCACGTMAVIIGMLSTTLPWGPVMAFLTSSPLMSPDGFIMLSGVLSLRFAIALTLASVVIGLGSGYMTHLIERKTDFLKNQTRFSRGTARQTSRCCDIICALEESENTVTVCCDECICCGESGTIGLKLKPVSGSPSKTSSITRAIVNIKWKEIWDALLNLGIKQILIFYMIFVAVGSLINSLVPTSIISGLLGVNNLAAVPLATLIGLPLYVTTQSAIPIIKSLLASGASEGAMLAFMISGAATSAWVIAGISSFLKRRAVGLYLLFIVLGAILSGYLYDLYLML